MEKQKKQEAVILPGSYDPVTLGHLDVIRKAAEEYSEVYAVIFVNPNKTYRFSPDERIKMLTLATDEYENVLVSYSTGLVINYMHDHGITKIIKGYRNEHDLEYEKAQAEWNLSYGGVETELWLSDEKFKEISSTLAREKLERGEELDEILPKKVIEFIRSR